MDRHTQKFKKRITHIEAPDECAVTAVTNDHIEISLKTWGYQPTIVRINWLLAQQLAADLGRVVDEARKLRR